MAPVRLTNIRKVLVANRGEIAVRCIRACKELGVTSTAIYTSSDATSLHVLLADEAVLLSDGDHNAYTDIDAILTVCRDCNIDAVIPGYGFLSESVEFADAVEAAGMVFVGPSVTSVKAMGLKHEARAIAQAANVPTIPGSPLLSTGEDALDYARRLGFPVMLKATSGGGGMGLQICTSEADIEKAFALVQSRAGALFKNSGIFLEKYYPLSRHIEVQVMGNSEIVIAFGERECSLQRRHQKVIEECPSPFVEKHLDLREKLVQSAIQYASQLNYKSVGTVEFLVDDETADYFFLEMNTRLQVEHGITEMCYGVDLVHLMLWQADYEKGGKPGIPSTDLKSLGNRRPNGAAIEARIYAETPLNDFAPSPGNLHQVEWPKLDGVRVDTWVKPGQTISPYYDPLIAKVMAHSPDGREAVTGLMLSALADTILLGTETNLDYAAKILESEDFRSGNTLTNFLSTFHYNACAIQILEPGLFTTIQDYPGRTSIRHGIPEGGPMDDLSSRVANLLVGNEPGTELLEATWSGPEILFHAPAVVAVCGPQASVTIDGAIVPMWTRLSIKQGQVLTVGAIENSGFRSYIAIKGGFPQVPYFLGSKSTTPELGFGGLQGRKLASNDVLYLDKPSSSSRAVSGPTIQLPPDMIPNFLITQIYCLEGPYGSDDILTDEGRKTIYNSSWKVSHNSSRSGVRLEGPELKWTPRSGGSEGKHPSNTLDYGYPAGGVNWTGDFPFIFSRDAPDLGGCACPITICSGDMWKVGQLQPDAMISFCPVSFQDAARMTQIKNNYLQSVAQYVQDQTIRPSSLHFEPRPNITPCILHQTPASPLHPQVTYRQGGDTSIIVEFGSQVADLRNTLHVHALSKRLAAHNLPSITVTPHVATLTVRYQPNTIDQPQLLLELIRLADTIGNVQDHTITARKIRLPVCFEHPTIEQAIQRYTKTLRPNATYLPDNVEYIRRTNALSSKKDVYDALLKASWLTVAVGFYVGTPVLFPLDPKYEFVAQKYNPSRLHTPGGSIGFGGSLLSIYPTVSPGGLQLVGRTLELWDASGARPGFSPSKPWLSNHFDVVSFFEVSLEEYGRIEQDFAAGKYTFDMENTTLNLHHYVEAFAEAERDPDHQRWKASQSKAADKIAKVEIDLVEEWNKSKATLDTKKSKTFARHDGSLVFESPVNASVWKVEVNVGDVIRKGQAVAFLEAMKMEIKIVCTDEQDGATVTDIATPPGTIVSPGTVLIAATKQ